MTDLRTTQQGGRVVTALAHPLTVCPDTGDTLYQGPLAAGQALVLRDRWARVDHVPHGVLVYLCDDEALTSEAEWGGGPDLETAWRYATGAACGPMDGEYDESHLIALLQVVAP